MKKYVLLFASFLFLFALAAFAQDAGSVTPPSNDEIGAFLQSLGSLGGAGGLVIVGTVVQGLLLFFRSSLAKFAGVYQLLIVSGLTLVGMIVVDLVAGKGLVGILSDASLLAAVQVFVHQIYTQVTKLPADQAKQA